MAGRPKKALVVASDPNNMPSKSVVLRGESYQTVGLTPEAGVMLLNAVVAYQEAYGLAGYAAKALIFSEVPMQFGTGVYATLEAGGGEFRRALANEVLQGAAPIDFEPAAKELLPLVAPIVAVSDFQEIGKNCLAAGMALHQAASALAGEAVPAENPESGRES